MADVNAIYISSISGGKCLENTQKDKGECRLRKWNKTAAQQWLVESSEDDPNTVAFKSVVDDQYLAALQPDKRNGGKIGVRGEKQWWTLEPGMGPEWFHVKSNSSFGGGKAGYLNDEWGRLRDDNKIQTYQYEANNPGFNTFYFPAAQAADKQVLGLSAGAEDDQTAKREELDAKEQDLQKREAALEEEKQKNAEKSNALDEKEAALAKREEGLAQKEQDDETKGGGSTQDNHEDRTNILDEKEAALTNREAEVERREKELASATASDTTDKAQSSPSRQTSIASTAQESAGRNAKSRGGDAHELCRLLRENDTLRLKFTIGELEAQLRERACQHKIKRPPRKINHKVEGFVYR